MVEKGYYYHLSSIEKTDMYRFHCYDYRQQTSYSMVIIFKIKIDTDIIEDYCIISGTYQTKKHFKTVGTSILGDMSILSKIEIDDVFSNFWKQIFKGKSLDKILNSDLMPNFALANFLFIILPIISHINTYTLICIWI